MLWKYCAGKINHIENVRSRDAFSCMQHIVVIPSNSYREFPFYKCLALVSEVSDNSRDMSRFYL